MSVRLTPVLALMVAALAGPVAAAGSGTDVSAVLATASADIDAARYDTAIADLTTLLAEEPANADVLNMLGYANRKSGNLDQAATWYLAALEQDPDHLGALEYQGEMFIELGDLAAAGANLARLSDLCGACEEQMDLAAALAAAGS